MLEGDGGDTRIKGLRVGTSESESVRPEEDEFVCPEGGCRRGGETAVEVGLTRVAEGFGEW